MLNRIKSKLEAIKKETSLKLLLALQEAPEQCSSAETLGDITELYSVAYPHLARLHREKLIETEWTSVKGNPVLGYRLTDKGRAYLAAELKSSQVAEPQDRSLPPTIKPLVSRIAAWFG